MRLWLGPLVVCGLFLAGCSRPTATAGEITEPAGEAATVNPDKLVLGLIPAENNQTMIEKFQGTADYLAAAIGRPVEVFTATDYGGVIEGMRKQRIHIAWLGPLSYVLAEQQAGAEAFAVGAKENGSTSYTCRIIVPPDSDAKSIADLAGGDLALVDPASTSGGLVPSYMIKQATGKLPAEFFGNVTYVGGHDGVYLNVKSGKVAAGGTNDETYDQLIKTGLITDADFRIVAESDPLPGSPLAWLGNLDEDLKQRLRDAITKAHEAISIVGYGPIVKYVAASPDDYQLIRDLVVELNLQPSDLLK